MHGIRFGCIGLITVLYLSSCQNTVNYSFQEEGSNQVAQDSGELERFPALEYFYCDSDSLNDPLEQTGFRRLSVYEIEQSLKLIAEFLLGDAAAQVQNQVSSLVENLPQDGHESIFCRS